MSARDLPSVVDGHPDVPTTAGAPSPRASTPPERLSCIECGGAPAALATDRTHTSVADSGARPRPGLRPCSSTGSTHTPSHGSGPRRPPTCGATVWSANSAWRRGPPFAGGDSPPAPDSTCSSGPPLQHPGRSWTRNGWSRLHRDCSGRGGALRRRSDRIILALPRSTLPRELGPNNSVPHADRHRPGGCARKTLRRSGRRFPASVRPHHSGSTEIDGSPGAEPQHPVPDDDRHCRTGCGRTAAPLRRSLAPPAPRSRPPGGVLDQASRTGAVGVPHPARRRDSRLQAAPGSRLVVAASAGGGWSPTVRVIGVQRRPQFTRVRLPDE